MIQIIHNPRCSKSRDGLNFLCQENINHQIIEYLNTPLSADEIRDILKKLNIAPIELVRKNETIWKENYKNLSLTDDEIITAMATHPKLIERPIFIKGDKAVIGRPLEKIHELL